MGWSLKLMKLEIPGETSQWIPVKYRKSQPVPGFVPGGLYLGFWLYLARGVTQAFGHRKEVF